MPLHYNPTFWCDGLQRLFPEPCSGCQAPHAVGIGWCRPMLSPEVTFHKQQRIDYYCNLNNFVSPKLELCRKALIDISIELYLIYIVSDYRIKYAHSDFIIFGTVGCRYNAFFWDPRNRSHYSGH